MEDGSARGGDQTSVRTAFASLAGAAPVGSAVSKIIAMACKSGGGAALENAVGESRRGVRAKSAGWLMAMARRVRRIRRLRGT